MKKIAILFAFVMFAMPFVTRAQFSINKMASEHAYGSEWQPIKIAENSNLKRGVLFYANDGTCGSDKVSLIRLVNTNS